MKFTIVRYLPLVFALLALSLSGCSSGNDQETSRLRIVNALPGVGPIDVLLDEDVVAESLPYGNETGFFDVDSDLRRIRVRLPGVVTAVIDQTRTFGPEIDYTLVISGTNQNVRHVFLQEQVIDPQDGEFRLRVANFAPEVSSISTYITFPDDNISGTTPSISSTSLYSFSKYLDIPADNYRVRFVDRSSDEIVFDSSTLTFAEDSVSTLIFLQDENTSSSYQALLLNDR